MGRLVSDPAHLTGTMGETGVFSRGAGHTLIATFLRLLTRPVFPPGFLRTLSHLHWEMLLLGTEQPSGDLSPAASAATKLHVRAKKP